MNDLSPYLSIMEDSLYQFNALTEPERELLVKLVCGNQMTSDELKEIEDIKLRVNTRNN